MTVSVKLFDHTCISVLSNDSVIPFAITISKNLRITVIIDVSIVTIPACMSCVCVCVGY